jgi:excisionase family DNA binding protein
VAAERVTIREAAARLGVSTDTVRRRIRSGAIVSEMVGGVWHVELPETTAPQVETTTSGSTSGEVAALRELVDALREQVRTQGEQLDARVREVSELHILLQRTQAMLPAPITEAAPSSPEGQAATASAPWWAFWRRGRAS